MPIKNIVRVFIIVLVLLLIPVLGNMFVDGWNWSPLDFLVMGALLFITGLAIDMAVRKISNPVYRVVACLAILFALLCIWAELAVGAVEQAISFLFQ